MLILADTNIILRWVQLQAPENPVARSAIRALRRRGDQAVISPQNLVEFWHVATRPVAANGLGFDPAFVDVQARRIERVFARLPDSPDVHDHRRRLVVAHAVVGRQVYDTRLVAVMLAHSLTHILTFNTADFRRFPEVSAVHPRDVLPTP